MQVSLLLDNTPKTGTSSESSSAISSARISYESNHTNTNGEMGTNIR